MEKGTAARIERLKKNGLRLTVQREVILNALIAKSNEHPSAEDLYREARQKCPGIGRATVYRTLSLFQRLGLVRRLQLMDGSSRYEINGDPHAHFICLGCGRVFELEASPLLGSSPSGKQDFQIFGYSLRIFGLCSKCRVQGQKAPSFDPPGAQVVPEQQPFEQSMG
ncbi:Fe2+ or Zn2+ uptake regulation protein [Desulfofundulus luciae]|uniref:Fe2+ or Zn2+ uptake regulation protein n=1 Tax=Desulfofundulus luciae TaxID=74702 RepID=A0ABU0B550_9FIRM|nr:Fur family transcriptional regulator [Desulfofundulus luciae]MDQ0287837.1 Fe2+ or Zn2+ uptake regulation protein [Desulfofundulus luciae]